MSNVRIRSHWCKGCSNSFCAGKSKCLRRFPGNQGTVMGTTGSMTARTIHLCVNEQELSLELQNLGLSWAFKENQTLYENTLGTSQSPLPVSIHSKSRGHLSTVSIYRVPSI